MLLGDTGRVGHTAADTEKKPKPTNPVLNQDQWFLSGLKFNTIYPTMTSKLLKTLLLYTPSHPLHLSTHDHMVGEEATKAMGFPLCLRILL